MIQSIDLLLLCCDGDHDPLLYKKIDYAIIVAYNGNAKKFKPNAPCDYTPLLSAVVFLLVLCKV